VFPRGTSCPLGAAISFSSTVVMPPPLPL